MNLTLSTKPAPKTMELARAIERDLIVSSQKLQMQKREIERLMKGRQVHHTNGYTYVISTVGISPGGIVSVYGRRRAANARREIPLGTLYTIELVP
jgi:hypothetical protein